MTPTRIRLHIDELVLHGFAPGDRYRIADALQARLGELLAEDQPDAAGAQRVDVPQADVGEVHIQQTGPSAIGAELANALHGGLRQWRSL